MRALRTLVSAIVLAAFAMPLTVEAQVEVRRAQGSTLRQVFEDFMAGTDDAVDRTVVRYLVDAMTAEIVAFPVGSSSGAFTYTFDPSLGVSILKNRGFGPGFAERATTLGDRGAFNFGFSSQRVSYESFDGLRFADGDLSESYESDLDPDAAWNFRRAFTLRSETVNFFGTVAILRSLDVGVMVPITRINIKGMNRRHQFFADPRLGRTFDEVVNLDHSSIGLSDVTVRAKWRLAETRRAEYAAQVEVRLPTGDADELRGSGTTTTTGWFLASSTLGRVSPHINVGYTFNRSGYAAARAQSFGVVDELQYIAGVEIAAHRNMTVSGAMIGRRLPFAARLDVTPPREGFRTDLLVGADTLHTLIGVVGGKLKIFRQGLVAAHLLFPLTDGGLKSRLTPVAGFEYSF